MIGVPQQLRAPGAQADDLQQRLLVLLAAPAQRCFVHQLARFRVGQLLQHRLYAGQTQANQPSLLPGRGRVLGKPALCLLVQAFQQGLVRQQHRRSLSGGLQVTSELGGQGGEFGVDTTKILTLLRVQIRATTHETAAPIRLQSLLLAAFRSSRDRLHALPQLLVEQHVADVRSQLRRDGRLYLTHLRGGHRARVIEHNRQHPVQHLPR